MNYQYFGLFLDEPTRNKLMQVIIGNPIISNLVFQRGSTIYLDHCTLLHKNQHEEMLRKVEEGTFIFKDGILYLKPHIVLKFSENQSVIAYFNSNEEMESWARSFIDFSKKPFVYLK